MKLKIRSTAGTVVLNFEENTLVKDLTATLLEKHFPSASIASYKFGYPPKHINALAELTLEEAGVKPNDQIIASDESGADNFTVKDTGDKVKDTRDKPNKTAESFDIPYVKIPQLSSNLILRNVPDDNSCLFNAVSLAFLGTVDWKQMNLRGVVAETIRNSPEIYTAEILDRPNEEYCTWIQKPESWGGAIELGILSKHLDIRIVTYDIELGQSITFQDEALPPSRFIILIYSGIHYDTVVVNSTLSTNRNGDVGLWAQDLGITSACHKLVELLQTKNYVTNTTTFRVRCLDCYKVLVGETGASRHANEMGHFRFGEVDK